MNIPRVVVLDDETLSTEPNAALLSIGAVICDFNARKQVDTFYANITPESSIAAGLHVSESTKAWWVRQGKEAQDVLSVNQRDLRSVLTEFSIWMREHNIEYVLGNGPRADNLWLDSAYKALGMTCPFKYWGDLDMRTLTFIGTYIFGMKDWHSTFKGVKHNALHDAINEAEYCNEVIQRIIGRKKQMAEFSLSIKTDSVSELADIVAKLNDAPGIAIEVPADGKTYETNMTTSVTVPVPTPTSDDDEGEQNSAAPAIDKNNLPWDARIHAGTKALNADGTWKKKRGVDDATVTAVTAELTGAAVPTPTPVPIPTPAPATKTNLEVFQSAVQELMAVGQKASPEYVQKFHGKIIQQLLAPLNNNIPGATPENLQAMLAIRDQFIANILAGVPLDTLVA